MPGQVGDRTGLFVGVLSRKPLSHLLHPSGTSGPELLNRRVELGAEDDGKTEEEREEQKRDRRCQRAVRVAGAGDESQVPAQSGAGGHEEHTGDQGAREQPMPRQRLRQSDLVERREADDHQQTDSGVVERVDQIRSDHVPGGRQCSPDERRPQSYQRQDEHRHHQEHHVEQQGEDALPDGIAGILLPVCFHDRVDERTDRR